MARLAVWPTFGASLRAGISPPFGPGAGRFARRVTVVFARWAGVAVAARPAFAIPALAVIEPGARGRALALCRGLGGRNRDILFQRHGVTQRVQESLTAIVMQLNQRVRVVNADRADIGLGQVSHPAQHRQQPARFSLLVMTDTQLHPETALEFGAGAGFGTIGGDGNDFFGSRAGREVEPHHRRCQFARGETLGQMGDQLHFRLIFGFGQGLVGQQALGVARVHIGGRRRRCPLGIQIGAAQQAFGLAARVQRHDQRADALVARAARAARAVQQRFLVGRQIGVDDQFQTRQVDSARRDIGGHAHTGTAIAHRLERAGAFVLRQFARQRHHRKSAVQQARGQVVHGHAGLAEDQRVARLIKPQQVDDGVFRVLGRDGQRAVGNVGMGVARGLRRHALRVALVGARQPLDIARHRGGEQQRATLFGQGLQDEFQIVSKAQIQHFVCFVQRHGLHGRQVDIAALDMVAQSARRADHDMCAAVQCTAFGARVHAPDAAGQHRPRRTIEPFEFPPDLQRQLPRWGDDQRARTVGRRQHRSVAQQIPRHRQPEGHRLARTGLRRHQQVAPGQFRRQHGLLHGGQCFVPLVGKRLGQRVGKGRKGGGHGKSGAKRGQAAPIRPQTPCV